MQIIPHVQSHMVCALACTGLETMLVLGLAKPTIPYLCANLSLPCLSLADHPLPFTRPVSVFCIYVCPRTTDNTLTTCDAHRVSVCGGSIHAGICTCTDSAVGNGPTCSEYNNSNTCHSGGAAQYDGSCRCVCVYMRTHCSTVALYWSSTRCWWMLVGAGRVLDSPMPHPRQATLTGHTPQRARAFAIQYALFGLY